MRTSAQGSKRNYLSMGTDADRYLGHCPRCDFDACEFSSSEVECSNCGYSEKFESCIDASDCESEENSEDALSNGSFNTMGTNIEQIPHDTDRWALKLENERYLRMTEHKDENEYQTPETKEYPTYDLIGYPNAEKGTSWIKHGVAWPTRDGKRVKIMLFPDKPLPEDGKLLLVESLKASFRERNPETPF